MTKTAAVDHQKVAGLYAAGMTQTAIGAELGVSDSRVRQIIKALGISSDKGGRTIRILKGTRARVAAERAKREEQERRIREAWGMSVDRYHAHVAEYGSSVETSSPMHKYSHHRNNALARGLEWDFTFPQWWRVWQESGKWEQRGRGRNGYVMARYGDGDTPYSPDTVYICTQAQNAKDSFIVRPERRPGVCSAADEQHARIQQMRANGAPRRKARLTADDARNIRADARTGDEIAATYGITKSAVSQIKTRKIWKHA